MREQRLYLIAVMRCAAEDVTRPDLGTNSRMVFGTGAGSSEGLEKGTGTFSGVPEKAPVPFSRAHVDRTIIALRAYPDKGTGLLNLGVLSPYPDRL